MADRPFPILFISSTRIGDAVLSSGLIKKLHEEIPHARFTIAAGPLAAPLFTAVPNLERVIVMAKEKRSGHWFKLWSQVRGRRWGLIVDMRGSGVARFLSSRRRAIYRRIPGAAPVHKVVEAARVLKVEDEPPAPFLYTTPEIEEAAEAWLAGHGPILAVAPGANWVGKAWPPERFAEACARILGTHGSMPDGRLLIVGSAADREPARAVKLAVSRDRIIGGEPGKLDLLTTYACLKRVRLFIGNDSGTMHLAAAAGAPTIGLFGPSDDALYAPWGPKGRVVRGSRDLAAIRKVDPELNQAVCHMFDLSVDSVVEAAARLLKETEVPLAANL
ncbi:glycosyltransferase family 9 protein [Phenylobacterium montanum]|uniref:Glycosyltransferase family 9 protein n=1 Tax=Phenylobacterium montanum TaxID=2823693 RepID=A0A975FYF6_9CAUL|nr:glycosyltransferase family 9 protein [Caulobacter sp. S6]QUD87158.1 glycosyltransferase family 9 protein [Caulobacter sp. S6]